jgi:hypothetical protein
MEFDRKPSQKTMPGNVSASELVVTSNRCTEWSVETTKVGVFQQILPQLALGVVAELRIPP